MRRAAPAVLALVLAAGCGGGSSARRTPTATHAQQNAPAQQDPQDPTAIPETVPRYGRGRAPAGAERAIRGWLAAVRKADFGRAASYFTVPAYVQNVSPVVKLATRGTIVGWNRSLPCGAVLTKLTGAPDGWAIATFRLVERRGGDCGNGLGAPASSAILVRDGHIQRWHRLLDVRETPSNDATGGAAA